MPLLNPDQFRARLQADLPVNLLSAISIRIPNSFVSVANETHHHALHPALLATVLAWGSKFSEHPILVEDREGCNGRSRISRMLFVKTLEIAESEKVHRVPSSDHVVISLLLEPLRGRKSCFST